MADTYKVLAQVNPSAATLTDAYTVPASTSTTVSGIFVTNRGNTSTSFRISVAVAGAVDDNKQYLYYDTNIPANDTLLVVAGLTLAATDKIRVYATLAQLSFNIFGVELT